MTMGKHRCTFHRQYINCSLNDHKRLRTAIRCNDKVTVQTLVDEGVTVNGVYEGCYKEFDPTEDPDDDDRTRHPLFTPLHLALMSRSADIVRILLEKGADINAKVWNGDTPLTMAAKMQNTTITDLLLAHDSIQNAQNYDGLAHLHIACMRNNTKIVRKLLMNQGENINQTVDDFSIHWAGWTPLHFAVHYECVETVQFLLSCGARIIIKDERHCSPLHLAHFHRNEKIIDLLLKAHMNEFENLCDSEGLSHFHIACTRDDTSVIEHFLKLGANIDAPVDSSQWEGWRPIHFAMLYECHNVIQLLLENKVKLGDRVFSELLECAYITENEPIYSLILSKSIDSDGKNVAHQELSIFHNACIQDDVEKIEQVLRNNLISIPSDLEKPIWNNGWTLLHFTVKCESNRVLKTLLDQGASIVAQDNEGRTPLHLAFKNKSYSTSSEIRKYSATASGFIFLLNITDNEGLSTFHILCALGHTEAIENFLRVGVNINLQVGSESALYAGFTPLHFAVNFDKPQVVDILLKHGADVLMTDVWNLNPFDYAIDRMRNHAHFILIEKNFEILMKILAHTSSKHIHLNHQGLSILHGLSTFENVESGQLQQYLTNHRDEINRTIEFPPWLGYTPLHVASICFHRFDIAELLLKNGANPSIVNGTGNTFIEGAFLFGIPRRKSLKEIEALFTSVADIEGIKPSYFHLACALGLLQVVKRILNFSTDYAWKIEYINTLNDCGQTPLHSFMLSETDDERDEITKLLLENGADIHAKDFELQTPLHYAQLELEPDVTRILINHGPDLNAQNLFGQTPLLKLLQSLNNTYAGEFSTPALVYDQINALLEGGSNINVKDREGLSPLMIIPHSNLNQLWQGIACILLKHVKKLQVIGYHISEDNKQAYTRISKSLNVRNLNEAKLLKKCKRELAAMKRNHIDRYTTLYSILSKSLNRMAVHCENVCLQNMIQSTKFIQKFPLYGFLIRLQVKNGRNRRPLLNESKKSLGLMFGISLPNQCIDAILDYLSGKDLENIIAANDASK